MDICDLMIIGAGPAGLSAAIQAKRLGIRLAVVERDRPGGQALAAHSIENYPGCSFGISGSQLMGRFVDHARKLGIEILSREARAVDFSDGCYRISVDGGVLACRALVVATGLSPKRLDVKGADAFHGSRLWYYMDPSRLDLQGKRILIIGGGDAAFDQAIHFSERAARVTVAMRGSSPRCLFLLTRRAERRGIRIMRSVIPVALHAKDNGLRATFAPTGGCRTGREWHLDADYVIACTGKTVDARLLRPLIAARGRFPLKPGRVATWPGLYLAGDLCRGNARQISIAAGDGMKAAMDIHAYLIDNSNDEHPFVHGR